MYNAKLNAGKNFQFENRAVTLSLHYISEELFVMLIKQANYSLKTSLEITRLKQQP